MKKYKKIVLVDDDNAAHIYHKLMLRELGFNMDNVHSFFTVDRVLDYLRSVISSDSFAAWPDFIFIDINMPLKTGYDFVKEFERLNSPYQNPKMYFVSNSKNPQDIERVSKMELIAGFENKFLEKEFFSRLI